MLIALLPVAAQTGWKEYAYESDRFAMSAPQEPALNKRQIDTKVGPIELRSYSVTDGDSALFVGVADYGSHMDNQDSKTVLQGAKEGALKNSNSTLISEKEITRQGYPGLAFETESEKFHFSARIYLVGSRLYQSVAVFPRETSYADTTRFHESLRFLR
jgi:hypothetical protein